MKYTFSFYPPALCIAYTGNITNMSNIFLDAAIEYASRGLAVFPLKKQGKDPLTAHGVKVGDRATLEEI